MPYTRAQLIAAFRAENPDASHIDDNKIFAAIAVEDPDLAKGAAEFQAGDRTGAATEATWLDRLKKGAGYITDTFQDEEGPRPVQLGMPQATGNRALDFANNAMGTAATGPAGITMAAGPKALIQNSPAVQIGSAVARTVSAPFKTPSVPLFTKHFAKSGDLSFQKYAPGVLDELRSAGPINTVEEGLAALQKRHDMYEEGVKHYLNPHKAVPAEEYRQMIRTNAINAIPETATKAERIRMMRLIDERIPENLTIGKIDKLRMESNARVRTGNLNVTKGIAADMTAQAVEEALADGARRAVSHAMDTKGLGGGEAVRQLHGRVGTIMHGEDSLLGRLNQAVGERAISPVDALKNKVSRVTSNIPGVKTAAHWTGYEKYAQGAPMTIDEALRMAVKNHGGLPAEITSQLRGTPGPHFQRMTDKPVSNPVQMEMSEVAPHNAYADQPDLFGIDATGIPPKYPHEGLQFGFGEGIQQTPYVEPAPVSELHEIVKGGLSYPKTQTELFLERSKKLKRILGK